MPKGCVDGQNWPKILVLYTLDRIVVLLFVFLSWVKLKCIIMIVSDISTIHLQILSSVSGHILTLVALIWSTGMHVYQDQGSDKAGDRRGWHDNSYGYRCNRCNNNPQLQVTHHSQHIIRCLSMIQDFILCYCYCISTIKTYLVQKGQMFN